MCKELVKYLKQKPGWLLFQEYDANWAKRIKVEKFRWHNSQWVEMVESQQHLDDGDDLYDDVLSPYLRDGDLLYEPSEFYYVSPSVATCPNSDVENTCPGLPHPEKVLDFFCCPGKSLNFVSSPRQY